MNTSTGKMTSIKDALEVNFEKYGTVGRWARETIVGLFVTYIIQALLFQRLSKKIAESLHIAYLNDDIVACLLFLIGFILLTAVLIFLSNYSGIYFYFYYSLWRKRIPYATKICYRADTGNGEDNRRDHQLSYYRICIEDSYREQAVGNKKKVIRPVIVRKEHLYKKRYWPRWAFEILLLDRKPRILKGDRGACTLLVDLTDTKYGIYNNEGKKYLDEKFLVTDQDKEEYKAKSIAIYEYIKSSSKNLPEPEFPEPIRWASGGVLPIVEVDNKHWVALFFRDINPVGLNVSNGGSESVKEYMNPKHIIFREFSEEFMVIDGGHASISSEITQKLFKLEVMDDEDKILINPSFAKEHRRKRLLQDGLTVKQDVSNCVNVEVVRTNFSVEVTSPKSKTSISNVIFTVNPNEFGIELIRIVKFKMDKHDYILDGEILEGYDTLIRMPVVMVSLKYLHEVYMRNNKSLGTVSKEKPYMDCKTMEGIPAGEYRVFHHDIELRKRYVESIKDKKGKAGEYSFHEDWLERFYDIFMKIKHETPDLSSREHKPLVTLCPVTWKTLELAFHNNYLKQYLK